jgi:hypothetical protein
MSYSSLFSRPTSASTSAAAGLKGTQEEGVGGAGILGRFQEQQVRDAHAHRGPTEALTFGDAGDFGDLQGPHKGAGLSRRVALHEAIFGKAQVRSPGVETSRNDAKEGQGQGEKEGGREGADAARGKGGKKKKKGLKAWGGWYQSWMGRKWAG